MIQDEEPPAKKKVSNQKPQVINDKDNENGDKVDGTEMEHTEDCAEGDKDGEENAKKGDGRAGSPEGDKDGEENVGVENDTPESQEPSTSTAVVGFTSEESIAANTEDCMMLPLQCPCGLIFDTDANLSLHISGAHIETKNWNCSGKKKLADGSKVPCDHIAVDRARLW